MLISLLIPTPDPAVVPILIGPLQALLLILPAVLVAILRIIVKMLRPSSIRTGLKVLWRNKLTALASIVIITGLCYGISYAGRWLRPGAGGMVDLGRTEWPMFRGSPERTGRRTPGPRCLFRRPT